MATGTVKWFNPTKGYGFIQPQGGGGRDIFVHISAVERAGLSSLNEGQHVEYELESTREGKQAATNLKVNKRPVFRFYAAARQRRTHLCGREHIGYGLINIVIEHEQRCVVMLSPTCDVDHICNNVEDIPQH